MTDEKSTDKRTPVELELEIEFCADTAAQLYAMYDRTTELGYKLLGDGWTRAKERAITVLASKSKRGAV